ncbi:hypothetical protein J8J32_22205, partial [Mycobacterium tuberculosis]|uniref:hypothetical protein n=1 Tax=Mycobacterium tuberculosis TaxID=1773 RepID=UPI001AE0B9B3
RATRLRPLSRDLTLAVQRALAPQERQRLIASAARRVLAETQAQNARAIGLAPPHDTFVDGRAEAPLESVNPDRGEIVFRFSL